MNDTIRYENRTVDFYYRNDGGGTSKLRCRPHLHQHIELLCMLEGEVTGIVDSREYHIRAGDLFVAFPNQVHSFVSTGPESYMLFIISPDLLPEYADQFTMTVPVSALAEGATTRCPEILSILKALAALSEKGKDYAFRDDIEKGYLLSLFGELFHLYSLTLPRGSDATVLKAIVNYCMQHYTADLSLAMLEEELHVSKHYISHLFSERLNIRFNDYINSFRVAAACRYLQQSGKSVTEIASLVGFNTLRTFNRAFLKQVGTTPSAYKKRMEKGGTSVSMPL